MMLKVWDCPDDLQHLSFAPLSDGIPTHYLCGLVRVRGISSWGVTAVADSDGVFTRVCSDCVTAAARELAAWA